MFKVGDIVQCIEPKLKYFGLNMKIMANNGELFLCQSIDPEFEFMKLIGFLGSELKLVDDEKFYFSYIDHEDDILIEEGPFSSLEEIKDQIKENFTITDDDTFKIFKLIGTLDVKMNLTFTKF